MPPRWRLDRLSMVAYVCEEIKFVEPKFADVKCEKLADIASFRQIIHLVPNLAELRLHNDGRGNNGDFSVISSLKHLKVLDLPVKLELWSVEKYERVWSVVFHNCRSSF